MGKTEQGYKEINEIPTTCLEDRQKRIDFPVMKKARLSLKSKSHKNY
jgi:hypothetical protein